MLQSCLAIRAIVSLSASVVASVRTGIKYAIRYPCEFRSVQGYASVSVSAWLWQYEPMYTMLQSCLAIRAIVSLSASVVVSVCSDITYAIRHSCEFRSVQGSVSVSVRSLA